VGWGVGKHTCGSEGSQALHVRSSSNGRFIEGKPFGNTECKEMRSGAMREVEQDLTAFVPSFECRYEALGGCVWGYFDVARGATSGRHFVLKIGGGGGPL
jgi:hypothetical protein